MTLSLASESGEAMGTSHPGGMRHVRSRKDSQLATCQRKRPQTEEEAVRIALMYGFPMTAYVCMGCGHWHNGRRYSSSFHDVDYRLRDPFQSRKKYLTRERQKEQEWKVQRA